MKKDWIYKGDFYVKKSMILNGKFVKDRIPYIVNGDFQCYDLDLISLEGMPKEIKGSIYCRHNKLTSLEGISKKIRGDFDFSINKLTSLEGCQNEINGGFNCSENLLTSLEGGPREINSYFDLSDNLLESLKYLPNVKGILYLPGEYLKNLEYIKINQRLVINGKRKHLVTEQKFLRTNYYKDNYWEDLLMYMIKEKIDLQEIKSWPDGFLNDELFKSSKGLSKFNL